MRAFLFIVALLATGLAPQLAAAQKHKKQATPPATPGMVQDVTPSRTTAYVLLDGAVVQRNNGQITPLSSNIRLPNGTKVNVKSGIVELPGGKLTNLHEGDYVNAEGGIVFATPRSAALAQGDSTVSKDARYTRYVQVGTAPTTNQLNNPNEREVLLQQKIDLLTRKVSLLSQTHNNLPDTSALDKQLSELDTQIKAVK